MELIIGLQRGRFVDDERRPFHFDMHRLNGASSFFSLFVPPFSAVFSSRIALNCYSAACYTIYSFRRENGKCDKGTYEPRKRDLKKEGNRKNVSAVFFSFFFNDLDLFFTSVFHHHLHHHRNDQQQRLLLLLLLLSPSRPRSRARLCPDAASIPGTSSASPTRALPSPPCL